MATLDDTLTALATMSPAQLRQEWARVHRAPVPDLTPELLSRGVAHHLQEQALGGLPATVRRELERLVTHLCRSKGGKGTMPAPLRIKPGTRLAREWHGEMHHVLITDAGYSYNDKSYASLSAIARQITGASWSGPRFFGLNARPKGQG